METNPFMVLCDRLTEVQMELMCRAWPDDTLARCDKASELRMALWRAIEDYRDVWVETVKEAYRCR